MEQLKALTKGYRFLFFGHMMLITSVKEIGGYNVVEATCFPHCCHEPHCINIKTSYSNMREIVDFSETMKKHFVKDGWA